MSDDTSWHSDLYEVALKDKGAYDSRSRAHLKTYAASAGNAK
jgi:hypothetical protein